MICFRRLATALLLAVATVLSTTAAAHAAAPGAATVGADRVTSGSARLVGRVDPNGEATRYYFEYGPTKRYGSRTPDFSAGRGTKVKTVRAAVSGLTPVTRYYFRLVASNASGVRSGDVDAFKTKPQPLGLQIVATPNPVTFNFASTISGTLTGTGNANRPVALQTRPFPYTSAFVNTGLGAVTDPAGNFQIPLAAVGATAQFRVVTTDKSKVTSPVLTLGVAVRVKTNVSTTRPRRGQLVRFSGSIRPARPGALYAIQKQTSNGAWVTVAGSITRSGGASYSGFSKRVRVRSSGNYRVFVSIVDGNLVSGIGRTVAVKLRR